MHATRMLMLNPDLDSVHAYTGGQSVYSKFLDSWQEAVEINGSS